MTAYADFHRLSISSREQFWGQQAQLIDLLTSLVCLSQMNDHILLMPSVLLKTKVR